MIKPRLCCAIYFFHVTSGDVSSTESDMHNEPAVEGETDEDQPRQFEPKNTSFDNSSRVQVDPNATLNDTAANPHILTALPVIAEGPYPYRPVLYTFRVKARGKASRLKHITAKSPPFHLQFDHTIAVIWTLFNKQASRERLGIVQLQWALHFLKSIYNNEGIHPKDVQFCIDVVQDYLIDEYADMSEESVIYGPSKFGDFVSDPQAKEPPFSVNYAQMIEKCPQPSAVEPTDSTIIDKELLDELENVKRTLGIDTIDLSKVVSTEQVMGILNEWKQQKMEQIEDELKMLYVIEDMMKNSDEKHFEGYTDESQFQPFFKKN